ncbi:S8 family serine peptidase [Mycoplasma bradburyae]|uniref:S8 family serine peptidase n=1 Tax=Mycoplasma bradburyae TaxID=2963128 RepID=UPI00233F90F0|nr:S8 family serine peptidase [Mycoplasma bradburyae]
MYVLSAIVATSSFFEISNINSKSETSKKQKIVNENFYLKNKSYSAKSINDNVSKNKTNQLNFNQNYSNYDYDNYDYFNGFISNKNNIKIYDENSILNLIQMQEQVISVKKSKLLRNYFIVKLKIKKNTNDKKKLKSFLDKYDLSGDFYAFTSIKNKTNINVSTPLLDHGNLFSGGSINQYPSKYQKNFNTNGYDEFSRLKDIAESENKVKYLGRPKIGIAVLEVGDDRDNSLRDALINTYDSYYFDHNDKNQEVINRWDYFWWWRFVKPTYGKHSTKVASIIAGNNGINPFHKLYGIKYNSFNLETANIRYTGLEDELNYIFSKNDIKVINSSWGIDLDLYESDDDELDYLSNYNYYSKYIDLLSWERPDIIFVWAAGNDGDSVDAKKRMLNNYALSYNSIVVGSHDVNNRLSTFSSKGSLTKNAPLILANGEDYLFKNDFLGSGTSYSAPFISGIIGNTLSKYEDKYKMGHNSTIARVALAVSSSDERDRIDVNQEGLDKARGAGVFDYKKIDQAFKNLHYIKWTQKTQSLVNNVWKNKNNNSLSFNNIYLRKGQVLRLGLSWQYKPNGQKTDFDWGGKNNVINFNEQDFDLFLKKDGRTISKSNGQNNLEFIRSNIKEDGYYEVVVNKYGEQKGEFLDSAELALSWTINNN